MTRQEFMSDEERVSLWRKELLENQLLQTVLQICDDEAPINGNPVTSSEVAAHIAYGEACGYNQYPANLRSLSIFQGKVKDPTKLKSTYGVKDYASGK